MIIKDEPNYCIHVGEIELNNYYDNYKELLEEIKQAEKTLVEDSRKKDGKSCKFITGIQVYSHEDSAITVIVNRTMNSEERKRTKKLKTIRDNEIKLKETRLDLVKEDPEYIQFIALQEKFKYLK